MPMHPVSGLLLKPMNFDQTKKDFNASVECSFEKKIKIEIRLYVHLRKQTKLFFLQNWKAKGIVKLVYNFVLQNGNTFYTFSL